MRSASVSGRPRSKASGGSIPENRLSKETSAASTGRQDAHASSTILSGELNADATTSARSYSSGTPVRGIVPPTETNSRYPLVATSVSSPRLYVSYSGVPVVPKRSMRTSTSRSRARRTPSIRSSRRFAGE